MEATPQKLHTITAELSVFTPAPVAEGNRVIRIKVRGDGGQGDAQAARALRACTHLLAGVLESAIGENSPDATWLLDTDARANLIRLELGAASPAALSSAKTLVEMATGAWRQGFWGAQKLRIERDTSWQD